MDELVNYGATKKELPGYKVNNKVSSVVLVLHGQNLSPQGAYQLEIINACSKKGLVAFAYLIRPTPLWVLILNGFLL